MRSNSALKLFLRKLLRSKFRLLRKGAILQVALTLSCFSGTENDDSEDTNEDSESPEDPEGGSDGEDDDNSSDEDDDEEDEESSSEDDDDGLSVILKANGSRMDGDHNTLGTEHNKVQVSNLHVASCLRMIIEARTVYIFQP